MTHEQSKAFIVALTFFVIASILTVCSIIILFELADRFYYGRQPLLIGAFMLIMGVICIGSGLIYLMKAGFNIIKRKIEP